MPHLTHLEPVERVYLIGIGGTAMASLAGMLKERGYVVGGSDEHVYPPMSTYLEQLQIEVLEGYTGHHLDTFRPDLVIIGNAAAVTNPEAAAVLEMDLPYTSMPEAIYQLFMQGKSSIVITGTHGKTTTTSLMAWLLEAAGREPSMVVGGIPVNFGRNYKLGKGNDFVIEGDEYNTAFFDKGPKFLHYHATVLLVNNIEFDHADIYPDLQAIIEAFRAAVRQVGATDLIVANADDPRVASLRADAGSRWLTFGLSGDADIRAVDIEYSSGGTEFSAIWKGSHWARFRTTLDGEHNVRNALADIAIARELGLSAEEMQKGLESFSGIKRRMEVRGVVRGVTVIDDFAHHPTAIETTVEGARNRYPGGRIWAVFEPKSISSGRKEFEPGYIQAFHRADRVIIGPIFHQKRYLERYGADHMMDVQAIVEALRGDGIPAEHISEVDQIARLIASEARSGDTILVMSSGAFGGLHEKILSQLADQPE
jgi:UDP-N-acetylmuramate: L-alanyl-gamma-D-glutamyl-meso-diaminopimelate ligase